MSLKQALINNYYSRKRGNDSESESDSDNDSVYLPSKSKRIYDQPMSWTRVKKVESIFIQRMTIFDVEKDMENDKFLKQIRKNAAREPGILIFDPENFKDSKDDLNFARHNLSRQQLLEYAKVASSIRRAISLKVSRMYEESKDHQHNSQIEMIDPSLFSSFKLMNK